MTSLTLVSSGPSQMSWRPQYRSSKFRNVYGKVANREHCFDGIPITKNVHDNHFCAVNARFLAIVTESAGGGSFLVIPLEQVGACHLPSPGGSPRAERSPPWSLLGGCLYFSPQPPSPTAFYFLILCPVLVPSQGFPEIHKNKCRLQSRRPEICSQNFPEGVPLDKSLSSGYPGFSLT